MERFRKGSPPSKGTISLSSRRRDTRPSGRNGSFNDRLVIRNHIIRRYGQDFAFLCDDVQRKIENLPRRWTGNPRKPHKEMPCTRLLSDRELLRRSLWMITERTQRFSSKDAIQRQFDAERVAGYLVRLERESRQERDALDRIERRLRRHAPDRRNHGGRPRASANHTPHDEIDEANSQRPPTTTHSNLEGADRVPGSPQRDTSSRAKKDSSSGN